MLSDIEIAQSCQMRPIAEVAAAAGVNVYELIIETSKINQKNPSKDLMEEVAVTLK